MRTYLIDKDKNEHCIDLKKTIVHSSELVEFEFATVVDGHDTNVEHVFVRRLAGQYFVSMDNIHWKKLARQELPKVFLNVNRLYNVYRGYKPSGMDSSADSGLVTQMPGKVVKIAVKVGDQVQKGQTLLILEAMKMENEVKSNADGIVKEIFVGEGQALEQGVAMMTLEEKP
ncbi:MAG: hypothetical protein A2X86_04255 [Bdellovibrionales bacterium GWA2_49_15]|nr:MAG: hypothetical protein A2X86_04255 [Bdellovibrionales bacterium GWA2_49_15]HAZ12781.1 hypothetical protein [Bdellovibrionales bacterium]